MQEEVDENYLEEMSHLLAYISVEKENVVRKLKDLDEFEAKISSVKSQVSAIEKVAVSDAIYKAK